MILSWLTAAAGLALSAQPAPQADPGEVHVWRLAHYLQEDHVFVSGWLTDWVETLEARSDGRIRVEWHHNNSLLRLAAIAPGVAAGQAEMGFATAPPHGEFTLIGLPFMAGSAVHGAAIANALLEEGALDSAFEGLVPALIITNAPSLLHTRDVAVRAPDELAGLRLRGATPGIRSLIAALGATPVEGYLAPQVTGLLDRGEIDGTFWPWEAVGAFGLDAHVTHHTEAAVFVSVLALVINEDALTALPDDLQALVREMTGPDAALSAAAAWDEDEALGRERALARGNTVITLDDDALAAWRAALAPYTRERLDALEAEGFPAHARHEHMRALSDALRRREQ
jgi:TRAP-type C4-dicarboxylate transport system substrate-binding protein